MAEKRLKFQCWQCKREYSQLHDLRGQPRFFTECPFCGEEAVVDLAPYRSSVKEIYQSSEGDAPAAGETYTFPEIVGHSLAPSGFISTIAGAATSISIRASGREVT